MAIDQIPHKIVEASGEGKSWVESKNGHNLNSISSEQEKQLQKEKEQVKILTKMQLGSLSNGVVLLYLQKFHDVDVSKYHPDIQNRFLEEIQFAFNEFKDFDESMIARLRTIRESMSCGFEKGKSNEYYRNLIIGNAIDVRVKILQESIQTITGDRIKIGSREFNKLDYEKLRQEITKRDQSYGVDIFSLIDFSQYNQDFKKLFANEFKKLVDKSNPKYSLIMSDLTRLPQVIGEKGFENLRQVKLANGQIVNLEELFKEYNSYYKEFKTKNRVFEFGNKQLKASQKGFGFNESKYNLGYDELKEAYKDKVDAINIENMGIADLVILFRVLFGIIPIAGDVVGGYDDFNQAFAGVNFDGSIQKTWEKVLGYGSPILGILSIIGIGYGVKVAFNSPKYAKVMAIISKIIEKFLKNNEMLGQLAKNEKVMNMLEALKGVVPKIGELLEKMKKGLKLDNQFNQKLKLLFPNGINSILKQGNIGNCYLLSAIQLIKRSNYKKLIDMVNIIGKGNFEVNFSGKTILLTQEELNAVEKMGYGLIEGSLGDKIISVAYMKHLFLEAKNSGIGLRSEEYGLSFFEYILKHNRISYSDMIFESGKEGDVLKLFLGGENVIIDNFQIRGGIFFQSGEMFEAVRGISLGHKIGFEKLYKLFNEGAMIGLGTKRGRIKNISIEKSDSTKESIFTILDFDGNKVDMFTPHAYWLVGMNINKGYIEVSEPFNSGKIIKFSLEQFQSIFSSMTIARKRI